MLRSVLAPRAVEQEGEWTMTKVKMGTNSNCPSGAGQRRYVVVNQERDALQTRNLRLFKDRRP